MKQKYLCFTIIVIIFITLLLSGCETIDRYILAEKLDEEPENYIEISEQQMANLSYLKEAILSDKSVKTPYEDYIEIRNLLDEIKFIKYLNEFYEISFITT